MKNTFLLALIALLPISMFAQEIIDKNIKHCDRPEDADYIHENRLIAKIFINDTLDLTMGIVRNCDYSAQVEVKLASDSLILSITNGSDIFAACKCYFEVHLKIVGITEPNFNLYYNSKTYQFRENGIETVTEILELEELPKYIFPNPKERMVIRDDYDKINRYTADSLKIGHWLYDTITSNSQPFECFYIINEAGQSEIEWYITYNELGKFDEICAYKKDEIGRKLSYCVTEEKYLQLMEDHERK